MGPEEEGRAVRARGRWREEERGREGRKGSEQAMGPMWKLSCHMQVFSADNSATLFLSH
jgi:hypothetical protein